LDPGALTERIGQRLGDRVVRVERIDASGNSRVLRVTCTRGEFVAKLYVAATAGAHDRLAVDFESHAFLWGAGLRNIARPVARDDAARLALYTFLEGTPPPVESVDEDRIDALAAFVAELRRLALHPGAASLGPASEACFHPAAVVANILARRRRFSDVRAPNAAAELRSFLETRFDPAVDRWAQRAAEHLGPSRWDAELSPAHRTLSPSDLGFHNALVRPDGSLAFVDFEHFGWDDPAKLIADFLWHPRMTLAKSLQRRFVASMQRLFGDDPGLRSRVDAMLPLFGLKWCMILLNEFLPEAHARRRFAGAHTGDDAAVLRAQLAKAQATLERVERGEREFAEVLRA